ncbi:MAG: hypothetical protein LBU05_02675, partial [Bifidobacteriaceae bacterium]|nr:hypothetical protein [Bifidobacteriaceae bacterium]
MTDVNQPWGQDPFSSRDRRFVPWHKQSGAWVVIGALTVAFALALVISLRAAGGQPGLAASSSDPSQSGGQAAGAAPTPSATSAALPAGGFPPVATAECPDSQGQPVAQPGQPAGATELGGIRLGCDGVPGGP